MAHEYIQTGQWNRRKNPDIDPNVHGILKYDKYGYSNKQVKADFAINGIGTSGQPLGKR